MTKLFKKNHTLNCEQMFLFIVQDTFKLDCLTNARCMHCPISYNDICVKRRMTSSESRVPLVEAEALRDAKITGTARGLCATAKDPFLLLMSATCLATTTFHRYIERPGNRFLSRLSRRSAKYPREFTVFARRIVKLYARKQGIPQTLKISSNGEKITSMARRADYRHEIG